MAPADNPPNPALRSGKAGDMDASVIKCMVLRVGGMAVSRGFAWSLTAPPAYLYAQLPWSALKLDSSLRLAHGFCRQ